MGTSAVEELAPTAKRARKSANTSLRETWFSWFTMEPRVWSAASQISKQQRPTAKQLVSYLKLFVDDAGFLLDTGSSSFCDDVLAIGVRLELRIHNFLKEHGESSPVSAAVLKCLRKLHRVWHLNSAIT